MLVNATVPPGATEAGESAVIVTPIWLWFAVTLFLQAFGNVAALAALAGISAAAAANANTPTNARLRRLKILIENPSSDLCRARSRRGRIDDPTTSDHITAHSNVRIGTPPTSRNVPSGTFLEAPSDYFLTSFSFFVSVCGWPAVA